MFLFVCLVSCIVGCFFFKQKTAYEMRISDWSSDVCSSDLPTLHPALRLRRREDETTASYPKADSRPTQCPVPPSRSEERRVGKSVSVRVDLGGRRIINKKNTIRATTQNNNTHIHDAITENRLDTITTNTYNTHYRRI